jgi:hypothetical protein
LDLPPFCNNSPFYSSNIFSVPGTPDCIHEVSSRSGDQPDIHGTPEKSCRFSEPQNDVTALLCRGSHVTKEYLMPPDKHVVLCKKEVIVISGTVILDTERYEILMMWILI